MHPFSFVHLTNELLARELDAYFRRDDETVAGLIARIAEFDERSLYLPAGYPSMVAYLMERRRYTEQEALKRIRVARTARRYPAIFPALADGRLNMTAVLLVKPHLHDGNVAELLAAVAGKSNAEIERLLAARFPKTEALTWIVPIPAGSDQSEVSARTPRGMTEQREVSVRTHRGAPGEGEVSVRTPQTVNAVDKVTPSSPESYQAQFTMSRTAYENMCYARALLGRKLESGDLAELFERGMEALVREAEKQRFARADRPRKGHRKSQNPRHIPADLKRAVYERDQGHCTFVSEDGHRCEADTNLEFDHVVPVARGGEATLENIRLLCRAHNQYAAEQTFGEGFMRNKRMAAMERLAKAGAEHTLAAADPARRAALLPAGG